MKTFISKRTYRKFHNIIGVPKGHPSYGFGPLGFEHRLKVEMIIGYRLKTEQHVHHHYNDDGTATLVVCENQAYHGLLHKRTNALIRWQFNKALKPFKLDPKYEFLFNEE